MALIAWISPRTLNKSFIGVWLTILTLILPCDSATAQAEAIPAINEMDSTVWIHVKSEYRDEWHLTFLRPGTRTLLPLDGPDRFDLVFRDQQGNWFRGDLLPLRQLTRQDPHYVVTFGGIFQSQFIEQLIWDNYRQRYFIRRLPTKSRVAITVNIHFADGRSSSIPFWRQ